MCAHFPAANRNLHVQLQGFKVGILNNYSFKGINAKGEQERTVRDLFLLVKQYLHHMGLNMVSKQ